MIATGLVARVGELALVLGELGLGLVADRLRLLEVAADPVLAVLERLLDRRPRLPREQREDDDEREPPQMISFVSGRIGFFAFTSSAAVTASASA